MNLKTTYLGLNLRTPLVPSASPLSDSLDNVKRMEDAGAAAVVLHSLFEEHISFERHQLHRHFAKEMEGLAEQLTYSALTFSSEMNRLTVGPESYLDEIAVRKVLCRYL
jgi:dihydroorotate dehydrogenase (fumarate)